MRARTWSRSGIRGSPAWTTPRSGTRRSSGSSLTSEEIPEYRRVDVDVADAGERPTDEEYDRYTYLVGLYRELGYDPAAIRRGDAVRAATGAVQLRCSSRRPRSRRDLRDRRPAVRRIRERASKTASEIDETLWDEGGALYADVDVRTGGLVPARSAAGLAPLLRGRAGRRTRRTDGGATCGLSRGGRRGLRRHEPGAQASPASSRLATGAGRSGPSSTGCSSVASTVTATPLRGARSAARCSTWPTAVASGSTTARETGARSRGARGFPAWTAAGLDTARPLLRIRTGHGRSADGRRCQRGGPRCRQRTVGDNRTEGFEMGGIDETIRGFSWETPVDRRTLLGKAAVAGAATGRRRPADGRAGNRRLGCSRRRRHRILRPVRSDCRAGGDSEVHLQGVQRRRRRGVRADHRSESLRRPRPGRGESRQGQHRRSRRPPRRLRHLPERGAHSRRRRRRQADQDLAGAVGQARKARHQDAVLRARTPRRPTSWSPTRTSSSTCPREPSSTPSPTGSCSNGRRPSAREPGRTGSHCPRATPV